jgi:hypothetical protein
MADLVRRAVDRVAGRFRSGGRSLQFQVFEAYDAADGEKPTYAALAKRLGIKESDVTNHLFSVREALRSEIKSELSALTASPEELEEEWNAFLRL